MKRDLPEKSQNTQTQIQGDDLQKPIQQTTCECKTRLNFECTRVCANRVLHLSHVFMNVHLFMNICIANICKLFFVSVN